MLSAVWPERWRVFCLLPVQSVIFHSWATQSEGQLMWTWMEACLETVDERGCSHPPIHNWIANNQWLFADNLSIKQLRMRIDYSPFIGRCSRASKCSLWFFLMANVWLHSPFHHLYIFISTCHIFHLQLSSVIFLCCLQTWEYLFGQQHRHSSMRIKNTFGITSCLLSS